MNIEKGKIIELEDQNEYYVLDKIYLHESCYLYISNLNPTSGKDLRFVEYIDNKVFTVFDETILQELFLQVSKHVA